MERDKRSLMQDVEDVLWLVSLGVMASGALGSMIWFVGRAAGVPWLA